MRVNGGALVMRMVHKLWEVTQARWKVKSELSLWTLNMRKVNSWAYTITEKIVTHHWWSALGPVFLNLIIRHSVVINKMLKYSHKEYQGDFKILTH